MELKMSSLKITKSDISSKSITIQSGSGFAESSYNSYLQSLKDKYKDKYIVSPETTYDKQNKDYIEHQAKTPEFLEFPIDRRKIKSPNKYWYLDRIKEFQQLKNLLKNWNRDFDCPNSTAIYWADYILDILRVLDFEFRKVDCSVNGGITLCFLKDKKYADIECFNDGSILAVTNEGDYYSIPDVWTVYQDDDSIKQSIGKIQDFLNH